MQKPSPSLKSAGENSSSSQNLLVLAKWPQNIFFGKINHDTLLDNIYK